METNTQNSLPPSANQQIIQRTPIVPFTFDSQSFDQLLNQYNHQQALPCSIDLTQALLMTSNMTAAANTHFSNAQFDTVTDYLSNADSLAGSMLHINRLLQGIGPADRSSNFFIAQKQLIEAQSKEDASLRDAINSEIVDGLDYVRMREKISLTRQRAQNYFNLSDDSNSQNVLGDQNENFGKETSAQNSQDYLKKNQKTNLRIRSIVKQLRSDARTFLGVTDDQGIPLSQIFRRLSKSKLYLKKRDLKHAEKQLDKQEALEYELEEVNQKIYDEIGNLNQNFDLKKFKTDLKQKIAQLKQVLGLEARIAPEKNQLTLQEIDQLQLTSNSISILNVLKENQPKNKLDEPKIKDASNIFGRYKKLPTRSSLLQGFPKESPVQQNSINQKPTDKPYQSTQEIVKVIGLEPELLFQSISKYKVDVQKIPTFSNMFDSYETFIPGAQVTHTAAPITQAQNISDKQSYVRLDGRSVLSLPFNPYQLQNQQKSKLYQAVIHDFYDNRNQALKTISVGAREKLEASAIKRVWTQIAKRDIPKAYRALQKYHTDAANQTQKIAVAAQRELRKKVLKSQRIVKENPIRCKKLTKEVMSFWRKRDRELADLKRKKEKFDKEMRKKQQEEEEQLLQKKRLEYLMKQSEIYAHFMANKMGMGNEQKQETKEQIQAESEIGVGRVAVDEASARRKMAKMINEDRSRLKDFDGSEASLVNEDDLDVNRFDTDNQQQKPIETPTILNAKLKEYQLRGLRWLDNLYEQGINGILADEMGLGKTIQAISLMAHIAESKGVWGPFLVVVPVTTLHNWQNELKKFCPSLKVLPYFGNQEERKKLSKFLDPKNMMNPALQIHVVITSYNLIVNNLKDQAKLLKVKWNYMILDEAQAIKNNLSRRWKVLLQFQTRNRLLLTGTPIQNSMAELWALLHFIMPKLFDNHEQFQEWFSKDIEASSLNQGELNKIQLKRLHAVLKPFMLRRLKKDVEQEIAPKTEVVIYCDMTYRQRVLYQRIKSKISYQDLHSLSENKSKMENLMNLVMHMRKVCNHPDLFEPRDARIPVAFRQLQIGVQPNLNLSNNPDVRAQMENPIEYNVPKLIFDELFLQSDYGGQTFRKLIPHEDVAFSNVSIKTHFELFNIFNPYYLHNEMMKSDSKFGIFRLLCKSNSLSVSQLVYILNSDPLLQATALLQGQVQKHIRSVSKYIHQNEKNQLEINFYGGLPKQNAKDELSVQIIQAFNQEFTSSILYREQFIVSVVDNSLDVIPPMIPTHILDRQFYAHQITSCEIRREIEHFYVKKCVADSIRIICSNSGTFQRYAISQKQNPNAKRFLLGSKIKLQKHLQIQKCSGTSVMPFPTNQQSFEILRPLSLLRLPNCKSLVQDCAKMQNFAKLIPQLVAGKHRCLVFCQMTRMLDLLEDYLLTQHLSYFRMDGSTALQDRRFMVDEYQKNPNIFAFLLSTRAGGLGINLIAADTVIFYDIDWNPTMDEQATDRAHRIGQTKKVTIYRLVTRGTVEEKIVRRAQQKQNVQSTVYGDQFKVRDVQMFLADDEAPEQQQGFIKSRKRGKKTNEKLTDQKSKQQKKATTEQQYQEVENEVMDEQSEESDGSEGFLMQMEGNENDGNNDGQLEAEENGDDVEMGDDY